MANNDKLAKLREKIQNTDTGGSGIGFWNPPQGSTTIRILPEVGEMPYFYQEVGRHYLPDKTQVTCPRFTTEGELECPICDLVKQLYRGTTADKELAKELRVSKSYHMNIVVRKPEDKLSDTAEGPFVYTPGVTIFNFISSIIMNPDYGDITDDEEGFDLTITREGEKLETKYNVVARRLPSPVHQNDDEFNRIFEEAVDLSPAILSEDPSEDNELSQGRIILVKPYNRIIDDYGLWPEMSSSDVAKTKVNDNPTASARDVVAARRQTKVEDSTPSDSAGEALAQVRQRRSRRTE